MRQARLGGQPLAVTYMSDGWGVTTATVFTSVIAGQHIRREGHRRQEILNELQFVKTIRGDGAILAAYHLPCQTKLGRKNGWVVFQRACDQTPIWCARDHGITDVVIYMYLQDGLHSAAFTRRMRARHDSFHSIVCADSETAIDV